MTVLLIIGLILLFFSVPYLVGNMYVVFLRKKDMGIVATYLSGMVIVYALLTVLQIVIIKFKLDFYKVTGMYNLMFIGLVFMGLIGLFIRLFKDKAMRWDIHLSKKTLWVLVPVILQGILYIVLKNPYFENNALLETARITMETGTIYEYNAFTGTKSVAGFPLSNKLMFLPMLYAYLSGITGVDLALLFNFVMPTVTFVSFYLVMLLWMQKLAEEFYMGKTKAWEMELKGIRSICDLL